MTGSNTLLLSKDFYEELGIAHNLQQALYPHPDKSLPYLSACSKNIPCYEIGGDYFDYFDLDGGRFCFALGDVSGKGIPAALLASVVQGILSVLISMDVPLPAIISNLNRNLVKRGTGNRFVTLFFGTVDEKGHCQYVNAGHNPPLLLKADGSLKELTDGGIVLGLFDQAQYECNTIRLHPNDHLILFTDGVVEALNTKGEEFGADRLRDLLCANAGASSSEILAHLQNAVQSFAENAPQHDDITMMILGYRESNHHQLGNMAADSHRHTRSRKPV